MNAREALRRARALGCTVETVRRTGEVRITPPGGGKVVTTAVPTRRKDASRVLVQLIKKLEKKP